MSHAINFNVWRPLQTPRKSEPLVVAILLGISIFAANTLAHNIDVNQAKQKVEAYAQKVARDRNYPYFTVDCAAIYRGHNHQVRCFAKYQNANTRAAGRYSCSEEITVYFQSHQGSKRNWEYYMTHVQRGNYPPDPCGNERLSGPNP